MSLNTTVREKLVIGTLLDKLHYSLKMFIYIYNLCLRVILEGIRSVHTIRQGQNPCCKYV